MRKVNLRSRQLRHFNSGAHRNSYFSRLKQLLKNPFTSKTEDYFSIEHTDSRYDGYSLPRPAKSGKGLFKWTNLNKYFTHAGIIAVAGFTILSNTCFGGYCDNYLAKQNMAMASTHSLDSNLIEIDLDDADQSTPVINSQKINQIASAVNPYTAAEDKKKELAQVLQAKNDQSESDLPLIQDSYLEKTNTPVTNISNAPRKHVISHLVKAGESLSSIADKYQISTNTIRWSNGMDNSGILIEGQELYIMPIDGIYYTIQDGDSLSSISEKYKSNLDEIRNWNNFASEDLKLGQKIILPGGQVPPPPKPVVPIYTAPESTDNYYQSNANYDSSPLAGSGQFGWPTSGMAISQYFGSTSFNPWHTGLDLDSRSGWDIFASDSGTVTYAGYGWGGGYGNHIIIDHGNGYQTLYGHLSALDVNVGDTVGKGQRIGTMGSTGWSTGPHLHFEIRYNGSFMNPLNYL